MILHWVYLFVAILSCPCISALVIQRAFQEIQSWTLLGEFCFLPVGGNVAYQIRSNDRPVPLVFYYTHRNGTNTVAEISGVDDFATDGITTDNVITSPSEGNVDNTRALNHEVFTTNNPLTDSNFSDLIEYPAYERLRAHQNSCTNIPQLPIFRVISTSGSGDIRIDPDNKDVLCLTFALAPTCHETLEEVRIYLRITNNVSSPWWRHVSADAVSLFMADLVGFTLLFVLTLLAAGIRAYLTKHKFYVHALNSCVLSMMLLLLFLGVNVLLHALFAADGYDVSGVRVVLHVIYISAQTLFVQAIFLDALKHAWCNDVNNLKRGYALSLIVSSFSLFYGLSLTTIHVYRVFSHDSIYTQYAQFSLQGFTWIIFVFTVLCTVSSSSHDGEEENKKKEEDMQEHLRNSLGRYGRLGPPHPPLRSLFGDYDYAMNLPAAMERSALQSGQNSTDSPIPGSRDTHDRDETSTTFTDFDHVVTPTPPEHPVDVEWIGAEVSGHYMDTPALPLGGCGVLVYSCCFIAVPLLSLWSPYLLPPWLTQQCVYGIGLINFLIGYVYFLASAVPLKDDVMMGEDMQRRATCTVERLTVL